jgi:AcrR family transcriptional regulator
MATVARPELAARRREEIVESAARVFADKGFHEAGIADIAADLGIGHGTFYRYFANKQDIAAEILNRVVERIAETMLEEDPSASRDLAEYRAQVERIVERLFGLFDSDPHLMRFFHFQALTVDPDSLTAALDRFGEFTALFLRNGVDRGFLRPDLDVELTAQALVAVLFDLTRRAAAAPPSPAERRRWVTAGVGVMFDGIAPH